MINNEQLARRSFFQGKHLLNSKFFAGILAMMLSLYGVGAEIQLPPKASLVERTAAAELQEYLAKITGVKPNIRKTGPVASPPVFQIVTDSQLGPEEWKIQSVKSRVKLCGGKSTGVLYAVYHYLEDECGVHWWNPFEETVPKLTELPIANLKRQGKPAFEIREIFSLYGNDNGRFAARSRFNGDAKFGFSIGAEYGGRKIFGSPDFCHTFGRYIPPEKYFKTHPEWFSLIDGKRFAGVGTASDSSQLCLSNQALRQQMIKKVLECIKQSEERARKAGIEPPLMYDISENDSMRFCQCAKCQAIVAREGGAQSGLLLDFVNEVADAVKRKYPNVYLTTFAYHHTEKPPKHIRPRSNILIVLCDTQSNASQPLSLKENPYFCKLLKSWSAIVPNLRIWDYAVTFWKPRGLPYASEDTYANDMRLFQRSNVKQIFTEMPFPILADVRDYKVWLRAKFTENPKSDWNELRKCFTDGFYGKAGSLFREYRKLLRSSQEKKKPYFGMGGPVDAFTHLDIKTLVAAHKLFDKGEKLLAGDETLLRRWQHARLGLDRATAIRQRSLMQEYQRKHGSLKGYPFDLPPILERIRQTWTEQAKMRLNKNAYAASISELKNEMADYTKPVPLKTLIPPEKFSQLSPTQFFDFTADRTVRWKDFAKVVDDSDAESGIACRLGFPNKGGNEHSLEKYKRPLTWGLYSDGERKGIGSGTIRKIAGPGYHWYKLGTSTLTPDCYFWFPWSWIIRVELGEAFDPKHKDAKFDIWARIKLTGPAFSHGKAEDPNAIYLERVVLVKKTN